MPPEEPKEAAKDAAMQLAVRGIPILFMCLLVPSPADQLRILINEYGEMSRRFRQATTD